LAGLEPATLPLAESIQALFRRSNGTWLDTFRSTSLTFRKSTSLDRPGELLSEASVSSVETVAVEALRLLAMPRLLAVVESVWLAAAVALVK